MFYMYSLVSISYFLLRMCWQTTEGSCRDSYESFYQTNDGRYAFNILLEIATEALTAIFWPIAIPYRFFALREHARLITSPARYVVTPRLVDKNPTGGELSMQDDYETIA